MLPGSSSIFFAVSHETASIRYHLRYGFDSKKFTCSRHVGIFLWLMLMLVSRSSNRSNKILHESTCLYASISLTLMRLSVMGGFGLFKSHLDSVLLKIHRAFFRSDIRELEHGSCGYRRSSGLNGFQHVLWISAPAMSDDRETIGFRSTPEESDIVTAHGAFIIN